jgi:heme-binding NEAT domain protein
MLAGFAACTSEGGFDFGSDSTVDSTAVTEQVVVTPEASPTTTTTTTTTPSTRPKPKVVEPLPTTLLSSLIAITNEREEKHAAQRKLYRNMLKLILSLKENKTRLILLLSVLAYGQMAQ